MHRLTSIPMTLKYISDDDLQTVQSNLQSDVNRIQLVAASQLTDYNLILQSL